MSWVTTFLNSSIGKKSIMAITGLLLCIYLIVHLAGNLLLFAGPETFNGYVAALTSFKPFVRFIEVILTILFLSHILLSVKLTKENRNATSQKYTVNDPSQNSSLFSRNMGFTGSILFIFLVTHLSTIWYQFQTNHDEGNFFEIVVGDAVGFGNIYVTILYIVAMVLLGAHLRHGFQSAFQSFGIRHNKYGGLIEKVGVLFWLIIPAGFLSIAVYFGLLGGAG